MITLDSQGLAILLMCLEGFLYGMISVLCFNLYPATSKEFRHIFTMLRGIKRIQDDIYALCILYILSTATIVGDLLLYVKFFH